MKLSSKAIELIDTHELTAELMAREWSVHIPVYDDGIDLPATRHDAQTIIRIQLKSRWPIDRRYLNRPMVESGSLFRTTRRSARQNRKATARTRHGQARGVSGTWPPRAVDCGNA